MENYKEEIREIMREKECNAYVAIKEIDFSEKLLKNIEENDKNFIKEQNN